MARGTGSAMQTVPARPPRSWPRNRPMTSTQRPPSASFGSLPCPPQPKRTRHSTSCCTPMSSLPLQEIWSASAFCRECEFAKVLIGRTLTNLLRYKSRSTKVIPRSSDRSPSACWSTQTIASWRSLAPCPDCCPSCWAGSIIPTKDPASNTRHKFGDSP